MSFPKHETKQARPSKRKSSASETPVPVRVEVTGPNVPASTPTPSMQHDVNHVAGLADVEESLDWIAKGISRLTSDEHSINLSTGYNVDPIKLTLASNDYDDTLDRLVTAFERIADSVSRLAGLNRPRLESWREQDEYEPRYKDIALDGGAPGPKQADKAPMTS